MICYNVVNAVTVEENTAFGGFIMLKKIVVDGILTALLLMGIALLVNWIGPFDFLYVGFGYYGFSLSTVWAVIVVGLAIGVVNALLVPLVMRLFKNAKGAILFAITVVVDAAALMLVSWINFVPFGVGDRWLNGWIAAAILGLILALVGPIIFRKEMFGRKR